MKKLIFALCFFLLSSTSYAVTTDNIKYGTSSSVTCTLNSLGSSATVGRCATAVDNTSTLADDYLTTVSVLTGAGAPANDKAVYVYMSGSEDGTNYENEENNASPSTDGSYTINSPTILSLAAVIPVVTASRQYTKVFNVGNIFGGVIPRKFSYVIVNYTGQTLNSTGNTVTITPITYTNT